MKNSKEIPPFLNDLDGVIEEQIRKLQQARTSTEMREELDNQQEIGDRVKQLRVKLKMTRLALAESIKIPESDIFSLEMGMMENDAYAEEILEMVTKLLPEGK